MDHKKKWTACHYLIEADFTRSCILYIGLFWFCNPKSFLHTGTFELLLVLVVFLACYSLSIFIPRLCDDVQVPGWDSGAAQPGSKMSGFRSSAGEWWLPRCFFYFMVANIRSSRKKPNPNRTWKSSIFSPEKQLCFLIQIRIREPNQCRPRSGSWWNFVLSHKKFNFSWKYT